MGAPWGLDCSDCPRSKKCNEWGVETGYKYEGQKIAGQEWERCPASYFSDPHLTRALALYREGRVFGSGLSGWPDNYTHWVTVYITDLHDAIEERKAVMLERNMKGHGIR